MIMVFDNIFNFANKGAKIFSVAPPPEKTEPQPPNLDFEDADENTYYDDTSESLFSGGIHGASSRAKVVQEQSPEARNILRFLGTFIGTTQGAASEQRVYANDPESTSTMASEGMATSSKTVKDDPNLQKDEDLKKEKRPKKDDFDFTKPPTAPPEKTDDPERKGPPPKDDDPEKNGDDPKPKTN
jgi:hypothetical protein